MKIAIYTVLGHSRHKMGIISLLLNHFPLNKYFTDLFLPFTWGFYLFQVFNKHKRLFYVYKCFVHLCVCTPRMCVCLVPVEARREHRVSGQE